MKQHLSKLSRTVAFVAAMLLVVGVKPGFALVDWAAGLPIFMQKVTKTPVNWGEVIVEVVDPDDSGRIRQRFNASREKVTPILGCDLVISSAVATNGHRMKAGAVLVGGGAVVGDFDPVVQKYRVKAVDVLKYLADCKARRLPSTVTSLQLVGTEENGDRTDNVVFFFIRIVDVADLTGSTAMNVAWLFPAGYNLNTWQEKDATTWPSLDERTTTSRLKRLEREGRVAGEILDDTEAEDAELGRLAAQYTAPNSTAVVVQQWEDKVGGKPAHLPAKDLMLHLYLVPEEGTDGESPQIPNLRLPPDSQMEVLVPNQGTHLGYPGLEKWTRGRAHIALRWTGDPRKAVFQLPLAVLKSLPSKGAEGEDTKKYLVVLSSSQDAAGCWDLAAGGRNVMWLTAGVDGGVYYANYVASWDTVVVQTAKER